MSTSLNWKLSIASKNFTSLATIFGALVGAEVVSIGEERMFMDAKTDTAITGDGLGKMTSI